MSLSNASEGIPQGDHEGVLNALTTQGLRIVQACQHLHMQQGVSLKDLLWMLHGVMGQVLSWGYK